MSNVVLTGRQIAALPRASDELETWFWQDIEGARFGMERVGDMSFSVVRGSVTAALIAEARAALPAYERAAQAPTAELMGHWLRRLVGVRNPPAPDAMPAMADLFAEMLSDFPAGVFTPATQRRAAQEFKFWPSVADVAEFLKPEADAIRRGVKVLRYLAAQVAP